MAKEEEGEGRGGTRIQREEKEEVGGGGTRRREEEEEEGGRWRRRKEEVKEEKGGGRQGRRRGRRWRRREVIDVLQQPKLILNGVGINIKLWPSLNAFRLMSDSLTPDQKVQIVDAF